MGSLLVTARWLRISVIACAFVIWSAASEAQTLSIRVESPQEEYVVGELLKCFVALTNTSPDTIHVVNIQDLDMNMSFMFIEISLPTGATEIRKTQYSLDHVVWWPKGYVGEPLAPGDSVQIFLYPNWSRRLRSDKEGPRWERGSRTFQTAGTYVVRFCYEVPLECERIWKGPGGRLYSKPITLKFRQPTPEESEILQPLWASGSLALSIGDGEDWSGFDEMALDQVITKKPTHPLAKYAYFSLARSLMTPSSRVGIDATRLRRGVDLCTILIRSYPEFRYEETRQHMANGLYRLGRQEEAARLLNRTLIEQPALKDNVGFMRDKIFFETGSLDEVGEWEMRRIRPRPETEGPAAENK